MEIEEDEEGGMREDDDRKRPRPPRPGQADRERKGDREGGVRAVVEPRAAPEGEDNVDPGDGIDAREAQGGREVIRPDPAPVAQGWAHRRMEKREKGEERIEGIGEQVEDLPGGGGDQGVWMSRRARGRSFPDAGFSGLRPCSSHSAR